MTSRPAPATRLKPPGIQVEIPCGVSSAVPPAQLKSEHMRPTRHPEFRPKVDPSHRTLAAHHRFRPLVTVPGAQGARKDFKGLQLPSSINNRLHQLMNPLHRTRTRQFNFEACPRPPSVTVKRRSLDSARAAAEKLLSKVPKKSGSAKRTVFECQSPQTIHMIGVFYHYRDFSRTVIGCGIEDYLNLNVAKGILEPRQASPRKRADLKTIDEVTEKPSTCTGRLTLPRPPMRDRPKHRRCKSMVSLAKFAMLVWQQRASFKVLRNSPSECPTKAELLEGMGPKLAELHLRYFSEGKKSSEKESEARLDGEGRTFLEGAEADYLALSGLPEHLNVKILRDQGQETPLPGSADRKREVEVSAAPESTSRPLIDTDALGVVAPRPSPSGSWRSAKKQLEDFQETKTPPHEPHLDLNPKESPGSRRGQHNGLPAAHTDHPRQYFCPPKTLPAPKEPVSVYSQPAKKNLWGAPSTHKRNSNGGSQVVAGNPCKNKFDFLRAPGKHSRDHNRPFDLSTTFQPLFQRGDYTKATRSFERRHQMKAGEHGRLATARFFKPFVPQIPSLRRVGVPRDGPQDAVNLRDVERRSTGVPFYDSFKRNVFRGTGQRKSPEKPKPVSAKVIKMKEKK